MVFERPVYTVYNQVAMGNEGNRDDEAGMGVDPTECKAATLE